MNILMVTSLDISWCHQVFHTISNILKIVPTCTWLPGVPHIFCLEEPGNFDIIMLDDILDGVLNKPFLKLIQGYYPNALIVVVSNLGHVDTRSPEETQKWINNKINDYRIRLRMEKGELFDYINMIISNPPDLADIESMIDFWRGLKEVREDNTKVEEAAKKVREAGNGVLPGLIKRLVAERTKED